MCGGGRLYTYSRVYPECKSYMGAGIVRLAADDDVPHFSDIFDYFIQKVIQ